MTIPSRVSPGCHTVTHRVPLTAPHFQVIPHSFGRSTRPPVIQSLPEVQEKFDLCSVLMDIEAAQEMADSAQVRGGGGALLRTSINSSTPSSKCLTLSSLPSGQRHPPR